MKPAGLEIPRIFAVVFILTLAAQPAMLFGVRTEGGLSPSPPIEANGVYAVSAKDKAEFSDKILLTAHPAGISVDERESSGPVAVARLQDGYAELKVASLDFSSVQISVVEGPWMVATLKILPIAALDYLGKVKGFVPLGVPQAALAGAFQLGQPRQKVELRSGSEHAVLAFSTQIPEDFSRRSSLVLRC